MTYRQIFPILSTADIHRLVSFYVTAVDAAVTYQFPAEGDPGYVALELAGGHLGIGLDPAAPGIDTAQRAALWLYADDCDEAFARLVRAGAGVVEEPADMPWGERVAKVTDPDGNIVHLGQAPTSA